MKRISVDWDGTLEHNFVKNEVIKWLAWGHYVEIVTTRYRNPAEYPWYREGVDDGLHNKLFKFAKRHHITIHFTNMEWKAKYIESVGFDYLVDDNPEEAERLTKCKFIDVENIHSLTEELCSL